MSNKSQLYGKTAQFKHTVRTTTVQWKQGSFLGIGGDRSQTYHECHYTIDGQILVVFVQSDMDIPKPITINNRPSGMRYA